MVIRSRLRRGGEEEVVAPTTLEDLAAELQALRKEIKKGGDKTPIWQKIVLRGVGAAGAAGGAYVGQDGRRPPDGYGRGRTAIVILPMAQSAPSSLVISTSQIQVVRPR